MTRRGLLVTVGYVLTGFKVFAQDDSFLVRGILNSSDHEAEEGYFAVNEEVAIVVKPDSEPHKYLTEHKRRRVKITIELDTENER